jgi:hypothetical protein
MDFNESAEHLMLRETVADIAGKFGHEYTFQFEGRPIWPHLYGSCAGSGWMTRRVGYNFE